MRPFTARRLALAAFVPVLLVLSVIPGCSNQSEGERCTDDVDCQSGLTCKEIDHANAISRCCYDGHVTDSRCAATGSSSATSNAGSTGSSTAGTSSGGGGTSSEAGAASSEAGNAGDLSLPAGAGGV